MTLTTRLAIVTGVVLLLGALAAWAVPSSGPNGWGCGRWTDEQMDGEEIAQLLDDTAALGGVDPELEARARGIGEDYLACREILASRREWTLGLLGAAVVLPAGVLFVGAGRRKD